MVRQCWVLLVAGYPFCGCCSSPMMYIISSEMPRPSRGPRLVVLLIRLLWHFFYQWWKMLYCCLFLLHHPAYSLMLLLTCVKVFIFSGIWCHFKNYSRMPACWTCHSYSLSSSWHRRIHSIRDYFSVTFCIFNCEYSIGHYGLENLHTYMCVQRRGVCVGIRFDKVEWLWDIDNCDCSLKAFVYTQTGELRYVYSSLFLIVYSNWMQTSFNYWVSDASLMT